MDLSTLYNTLSTPPGQLQQAENEMMERFKAAALSITHLYKSSVHTSKQAYSAGYSACLADVLQTVQASLSTISPERRPQPLHGTERTNDNQEHNLEQGENAAKVLGRLMDWIEARQEAMKLEAEEEKEKEEAEGMPRRPPVSRLNSNAVKKNEKADQLGRSGSQPPPPSVFRQRDALVQAVANARARESAGLREEQEPVDMEIKESVTSPQIQTNPSSPMTPTPLVLPSSNTTYPTTQHIRPYKSFSNHRNSDHRSKMMNLNKGFQPNLSGLEIPVFPSSNSHNIGNDAPTGGKRPHESAFGNVPFGSGVSVFGVPPSTGTPHGRGRRRGGGFAGFARQGTQQAQTVPVSDGESESEGRERERKRVNRR